MVDPEGGGQDDRRFSMGHGCPIEKSRRRLHCDVGLDVQAISFGDFSLGQQRKVTRPRSGRKLCLVLKHERRDVPVSQKIDSDPRFPSAARRTNVT